MDNNAWTRYISVTTHPDNDKTIAAKVGVSPSTIGRWRSGEIDPKPRQVVGLARAYGKSPLSALVAAGYLSAEDLEGELTLSYAADPDEISTLQLVEELRNRLETMNDYIGWLKSIGLGEGHPAGLTPGVLRYIHPDGAPSEVDGMDFIRPIEKHLVTEEVDGHTVYRVNRDWRSSIDDLPPYQQEQLRETLNTRHSEPEGNSGFAPGTIQWIPATPGSGSTVRTSTKQAKHRATPSTPARDDLTDHFG